MKLAAMRDKLMHSSDSIVYRQKHLQELTQRFYGALRQESTEIKESLNASENRMRTVVSGRIIEARSQIVKTGDALKMHTGNTLEKRQNDLSATIRLLDAYSPLKVMERGYSVVYKDGKVISSIEDTEVKDTLKVRMQDGFVHAEVISKEKLHG